LRSKYGARSSRNGGLLFIWRIAGSWSNFYCFLREEKVMKKYAVLPFNYLMVGTRFLFNGIMMRKVSEYQAQDLRTDEKIYDIQEEALVVIVSYE
jgi:hypothetical protein